MDVGPPELLIILIVVLVLFGGKKLPELARSIGQAKKEFERGSRGEAFDAAPEVAPPVTVPEPAEVAATASVVPTTAVEAQAVVEVTEPPAS